MVLNASAWNDAHLYDSISPPRNESPEASDFLPGFTKIPGPASTCQGFFPQRFECLCRYLTLTYLFIFDASLLSHHHRTCQGRQLNQSFGARLATADNMPSKVESKKPSSDDADSSEVAEDKPEKEKEGGIKDYFVSDESEHLC